MSEETTLTGNRPKKLWDGALKMVRGENNAQLMEQFTAEMTLVAEGLCEDQSRLREDVDRMVTEEDRRVQKLESRIGVLESALEEERAAHDRDVTEMRTRIAELEKKAVREDKAREREKDKEKESGKEKKSRSGNIIRDLTVLVSIAAGAWVIVTILNMIK